ncbi:MAG: DUF11 domain-containing protein [Chloroflexi bacterium]|nr:DUF11 domain-containing protein [Chloroflexota bacterium]
MRRLLKSVLLVMMCGLLVLPAQAAPLYAGPNPVLTITASPFPLVVNQLARITIVGTNAGPTALDNVTITSGMPNNIAIEAVSASQGNVSVYNSAITVHAGHLDPGQSVTVYVDVAVVAAYPTDAPFNVCAGLTYTNGVARLSCLPNQIAVPTGSRPTVDLAPNGQRPINDPNRPPVTLPVSGAPIDAAGLALVLSGLTLIALSRRKR